MTTATTIVQGPVAVDFETYYDKGVSIKTMGVDLYLRHPKCDIYLVSVVGDDGEEFVGHPDDFDWWSLEGRELWSHNASFDRRVYYYLRKRSPWRQKADVTPEMPGAMPDLLTPLWNCTANLATYNRAGRSLKAATLALLGVGITKDVRDAMKGKTAQDAYNSPPLNPGFANLYEEVCEYALSDSRYCRDLARMFGRLRAENPGMNFNGPKQWPAMERALSDITTRSCHQGLPVDVEALETGKALLETKLWETDKSLPWVAEGFAPTSPKGLAEWCRRVGIPHPASTAEDDERCERWETEYGEQYPWVASMRERRKANRALKLAIVLLNRQDNGWFSYGLKYGGAHTLRWSGGDGFNVQNFSKKPAFGFDLRATVKAPEGFTFIIGDLSQIEARITPYLARDTDTIDAVRNGMSIYEVHARKTMGWTGGKLKTEDPTQYALAKARVLALGFGCGWQKFQIMAATEKYGNLILSDEVAKKCVKEFRAQPKIPRLWNRLENDFRASVGGNYELELPSNRVMTYFDVSVAGRDKTDDDGEKVGSKRSYRARTEIGGRFKWLYGGLLTENLVQATARDVFGEALVALDEAGYQIIFHVHDEVTVMVREEDAETAKIEVEQILSRTPDWLPGCPIGAEVNICNHYEK